MNKLQLTKKESSRLVHNLANINVPRHVLESTNVGGLILDIAESTESTKRARDKLKEARKAQEEGNFVGNWWHDRADKIKDANLDLGEEVSSLTEQSGKLLVFNVGISKILLDQQNKLEEQQDTISQQAREIQSQNKKIEQQQEEIKKAQEEMKNQQKKLYEVNEGLLAMNGITEEQAIKLIDVVERTENLEGKIKTQNIEFLEKFYKVSSQVHKDIKEDIEKNQDFLSSLIEQNQSDMTILSESIKNNSKKYIDSLATIQNKKISEFSLSYMDKLKKMEEDISSSVRQMIIEMEEQLGSMEKSITEKLEQDIERQDAIIKKYGIALWGIILLMIVMVSLVFYFAFDKGLI